MVCAKETEGQRNGAMSATDVQESSIGASAVRRNENEEDEEGRREGEEVVRGEVNVDGAWSACENEELPGLLRCLFASSTSP